MLAKRLFDLAAALAGLLLLAPLLLLLAAWIKWDSPGPALFRQRRVGRDGVPFTIYKFRTMRAAAEDLGQLSVADDARATRAGRLLRRHKLDELPQLLNVLLGQMSLVGPRPEVPRYVAHYPPKARAIVLSVAPGITDWAALHFRDEGELLRRAADPEQAYLQQILPAKLDYYVRYVQQRSFGGDLRILFCTLRMLLFRRAPAPPASPDAGEPYLRLLQHSRLAPQDRQSLLIALLRGLAALQVAAAHLRAHVFPGLSTLEAPSWWYQGLAFGTGFAHQAVVVFFVISGWLVGGSLLDRIGQPRALRDYAVDRLTRLWIVLLPGMLLMLLLALGQGTLDPAAPSLAADNPWSLASLLGNLAGLQTLAVPPFGDNFPLWSLAFETWYYALFPVLLLSLRGPTPARRLAAAALVLAIAACLRADILLYFVIWLMGAAASRVRLAAGRVQRWLFGLAWMGVALVLRLLGQDGDLDQDSWLQDMVYSLLVLLCLCGAGRRGARPGRRWLVSVSNFLAGFSFTLYVLHVPLLRMLWDYRGGARLSPNDPASLAVYAAMLAVCVLLSYLFHLPFEAQTARLRRRVKLLLPERTGQRLGAPARPGDAA
jgi:lipopolysaccharide/colanic/teichoic acid biosynthesis glycosyltransferase/peptidoglycan/LPS O-acetylase OafA/YrhL